LRFVYFDRSTASGTLVRIPHQRPLEENGEVFTGETPLEVVQKNPGHFPYFINIESIPDVIGRYYEI
jgi:hypothetical protein